MSYITLDGDDRQWLTARSSLVPVFSGNWTFSTWIRNDDPENELIPPPGSARTHVLFSTWPGSNTGIASSNMTFTYTQCTWHVYNGVYSNRDTLIITQSHIESNATQSYWTARFNSLSGTGISDGNWHHLIITVDKDTLVQPDGSSHYTFPTVSIYLDGALLEDSDFDSVTRNGHAFDYDDVQLPDVSSDPAGWNSRFALGGRNYNSTHTAYFSGGFDDTALCSKEFTQTDVDNIYNDGAPPDLSPYSTDLEAWWRMGDDITYGNTSLEYPRGGIIDKSYNNNCSVMLDGQPGNLSRTSSTVHLDMSDDNLHSLLTKPFSVSMWVRLLDVEKQGWLLGGISNANVELGKITQRLDIQFNIDASSSNSKTLRTQLDVAYKANSEAALLTNNIHAETDNAIVSETTGHTDWFHLVVAYDSTDIKIYKNGSEITNTTVYAGVSGGPSNIPDYYSGHRDSRWPPLLGQYFTYQPDSVYYGTSPTYTSALSGGYRDFAFWGKTLDSSDVSTIYNSGKYKDLTGMDGLSGWWNFSTDSSDTRTFEDRSDNNTYARVSGEDTFIENDRTLYFGNTIGSPVFYLNESAAIGTINILCATNNWTTYPSVSSPSNLYLLGPGTDGSVSPTVSPSSTKVLVYDDGSTYRWTASSSGAEYKLCYNGTKWIIFNTSSMDARGALWELIDANKDVSYLRSNPTGTYTPVSANASVISNNIYVSSKLGKLTRNYTTNILRTWYKERRKRKNPSKILKTNDTEYGSITGHWYLSGSDTGYDGKWYNNVTDVDNPSDGWLLQYSPSISTWTITSFVNDTVYYRGYPCDEDDGTKDVAYNPVTGKWRGMHQGPCGDRPRGVYYSIYSGASGRVRLHDEYPKPSVFWSTHKSQTWSDENDDDIIDDEELDDTGAIGNLMKTYTLASTSVMISSTDACGENFNIVSEGSLKAQRDEGKSYTTAKQSTERTIVPAFGTGIRNTKHLPFTSDVDDMLDDVDDRRIKGEDGDSPSNTSNADGSSGDITSGLKKRSTLIVSESSRNHLYFHTTDQTQEYPDYPFIIKGSLKTDSIFQTYTSQHTGILETIFFKTSGCFTAGFTLTAHKGQFDADDMTSFTSDQKLTEVTILTSDAQPYGKIEVHLNIPVEQGAQYIFEIGGDTELVDAQENVYPLHLYAIESTGISATDSGTLDSASLLPYSCGYIGTSNWPTSIANNEAWLQPGAEVTSTSIDYMWTGLWFEAKVYDSVEEKTAICTYNGWRWERMHIVWNTEYREYEDIGPK